MGSGEFSPKRWGERGEIEWGKIQPVEALTKSSSNLLSESVQKSKRYYLRYYGECLLK